MYKFLVKKKDQLHMTVVNATYFSIQEGFLVFYTEKGIFVEAFDSDHWETITRCKLPDGSLDKVLVYQKIEES